MFKIITVQRHQRVAVLLDGTFQRLLAPGRHVVWIGIRLVELVWFDLNTPVQALDIGDPLPHDLPGTEIVRVGASQRLIVSIGGAVLSVLRPGNYRVWHEAEGLELAWGDVDAAPSPLADDDVRYSASPVPWVEIAAGEHRALILKYQAEPVRLLEAGRYRLWSEGPWSIAMVPTELQLVELAVQDLVTADQVAVRLKPTATIRITDPLTYAREPKAMDLVYTAVQLGLRKVVADCTLEQLMSEKQALTEKLLAMAAAHLPQVGVTIEAASVKDVILPGEVKDLLNKVTLAKKESEAMAIRRREEVAQTRQLQNTAKMLANNPVLMRLKELEAMGDLVAKIDKLVVVGGGDLVGKVLSGSRDVLDVD